MTDIVERLRTWDATVNTWDLLNAAADEIERLRNLMAERQANAADRYQKLAEAYIETTNPGIDINEVRQRRQ